MSTQGAEPAPASSSDSTRGTVTRRLTATFGATLIVFLTLLIASLVTIPDYGLTWDEPYYMTSQGWQREWFAKLLETPTLALSEAELEAGWNRDPYHNPHPPFPKTVSNLLAFGLRFLGDPLTAFRASTSLFFALTGALIFTLARRHPWTTSAADTHSPSRSLFWAGVAVALWATTPRVFAHSHFLTTDMPITFFSVALVSAWLLLQGKWRIFAFSIVWGAALATKFTAVLLPAPIGLWLLLGRRWVDLRDMLVAGLGAIPIVWLLVPYWWHHPISGPLDFVMTSLTREDHTPVSVMVLGTAYDFKAPLYTAWLMLAVATPVTLWLPAAAGALASLKHLFERQGLWFWGAVLPIATMMLPNAPKHDGIRLFLHTTPFLALLAAFGLHTACERLRGLTSFWNQRWSLAITLAMVAGQAAALVSYHPLQLSYYNRLVGGLPGAKELGLETTYWMDAYTPEFLTEMNRVLPSNTPVQVIVGDPYHFRFLQALGRIRPDLQFSERSAPFALVLMRRSVLGEAEQQLSGLPEIATSKLHGVTLARLVVFASASGDRPPKP